MRPASLWLLSCGLAAAQISFGPSQEIGDAFPGGPGFTRAVDMDGDGDLDVIAAERDLDGILNWDEFAFGSDAAVADLNHPGRPRLESGPTGLSYTFQRRTDGASVGLFYDKFRSGNLLTGDPWSPPETTETASPGYERVRFPILPGQPQEFFKTEIPAPSAP